jgi:hypothetical protein
MDDKRIEEIGREWAKEPGFFDFEKGDFVGCVRAILAEARADGGKGEADAYNRTLRIQLEQEWADVRKLKEAYTAPPTGESTVEAASEALRFARKWEQRGVIVTIERRPQDPLAMGNHAPHVEAWPKRGTV